MGGTEEKDNSEKKKRRDEESSGENLKLEEDEQGCVNIRNRRRIVGDIDEQKKRHSGKPKVFGLSTILIWLVASSPFIVHVKPPTPITSFVASSESDWVLKSFFDRAIDSIFDITSRANKMYREMDQQYDYYQPAPAEQHQPKMAPFYRPMGLRWRDDQSMMQQYNPVPVMPVLTEHRSASPFGRSSSPSRPTTSNRFDTYSYDSPSLEDADLIDVLWRSDIAIEKGVRQVAPAEQYERDLQMLTEKSTITGLTAEEHARYEDLSKGMFQDFYPSFNNYNSNNNNNNNNNDRVDQGLKHMVKSQDDVKEYNVPTDEDLAALLEDVSKEESQLNLLFETSSNNQPLLQNVSLSEGIVYSQNNLTEISMLRNDELTGSGEQQQSAETFFNSTTDSATIQQYLLPAEAEPVDVFPQTNFAYVPMTNESSHEAISNGNVEYDHNYAVRSTNQPPNNNNIGSAIANALGGGSTSSGSSSSSALSPVFDPYHSMRHSFSDCTDSSSTCSRLSSESPRYNSETTTDNRGVPTSRFHGKLVPNDYTFGRQSPVRKVSRVIPLISQQQRKRGRQSKDEQLASENSLPVSAHQISEMSLSELQQVLKMEKLTEAQKQLIRKIRRRGKNKVAARTCRQRRTDRHDRAMEMNYI